jgi:hypothetical protein
LLWRCFSFFFLLLLFFRLCASLISRLALDIILLQRLGVIGIILILIYSLYRKNLFQLYCAGPSINIEDA